LTLRDGAKLRDYEFHPRACRFVEALYAASDGPGSTPRRRQYCVMQDVDYAVIAVRNDYRESDDVDKVCRFLETTYVSGRLVLPLKGVLIIGY
jgi:hypothetical protein